MSPTASATGYPTLPWSDSTRARDFQIWLEAVSAKHGLDPASVRMASADASFRRYFRVDTVDGGTRIVMDAPPAQENCVPFVRVTKLMHAAGLSVPELLEWDETHGFMLMSDLGRATLIEALDPADPQAARPLYEQALDALLRWQQASKPGVLPPYNEALLRRELELFPDWYLARHRGVKVDGELRATLDQTFKLIQRQNLAAPAVYVHRDFMPRNLILPDAPRAAGSVGAPSAAGPSQGASAPSGGSEPRAAGSVGVKSLGVLDYQDAVHGPITYDIASLMRDAFLSWDEEFVLDITIRYWERARRAGLMDFEDWASDFGSFWRAVEWMGLQRHLKVAGIFARITLRDGKPKYLADAPRFIAYIRHTARRYRELTPLLRLVDQVEGSEQPSGWSFGRA
jgi:aminoglycoside/choline kinase family phosphotransferase